MNFQKIKHSVSSPPYKVWGNFFHKKAWHGVKHFFGQIFWRTFYKGTNDQVMYGGNGEKLMVKRFQKSIQVIFFFHWLCPGLLIYYLKSWHHKQGIEFEKHILYSLPLRLEISCKVCFLFQKNYSSDLFFDVLIIGFFQIYIFMGQTHGEVS